MIIRGISIAKDLLYSRPVPARRTRPYTHVEKYFLPYKSERTLHRCFNGVILEVKTSGLLLDKIV